MSERRPYSEQDLFDSLADYVIELDEKDEGYDPETALAPSRDRSLWFPDASDKLRMPTRGYYPDRFPVGAIVHFTGGRSEHDERNAEDTIKDSTSKGYCYFCIARNGRIYQTAPLDHWGSHAGKSSYPGLGNGVSRRVVGIEICNAGKLAKTPEGFAADWNKYYKAGDPRCTYYEEHEVRHVRRGDNILADGYFHMYTPEQEASLVKLLLWLRRQKPDIFQWKYVVGHDEVSPRRKNDPGGSLSWRMPEFRRRLAELEAAGLTELPPPAPAPVPKPGTEPEPAPPIAVQPEPVQQPEPVAQPEAIPIPGSSPDTEPVPPGAAVEAPSSAIPAGQAIAEPSPAVSEAITEVPEAAGVDAGARAEPDPEPEPAAAQAIGETASAPQTDKKLKDVDHAYPPLEAGEETAEARATPAPVKTAFDALDLKLGPEFVRLLNAYRDERIEFPHLKDITFAQWALESGYGTSEIAIRQRNFAGMKWRPEMAIFAREVYYRPAHDPKDSAYCGFATLEDFIRGYWHRLDIRSLPYATRAGGWRKHASGPTEFISFIGPIWAPSGGDNSPLNNGYIQKILRVQSQLQEAGLLPSQAMVTRSLPQGGEQAPSQKTINALARSYEATARVGGVLSTEQAEQARLVGVVEECAARGDHDGVNTALARLNTLLDRHQSTLPSKDVRRLVSTLISSHSVRRTSNADANIYELIGMIEKASLVVPPSLIEINRAAAQIDTELAGRPPHLASWAIDQLAAALRDAGAFDWLARIADRLIASGNRSLALRRHYAEALLELGHVHAAISILELMLVDAGLPKDDAATVHAQLGRAYARIYTGQVRTPDDSYRYAEMFAGNLRTAIRHYGAAFDSGRPVETSRYGIRLAALLRLAESDGLELDEFESSEKIARQLLDALGPLVHQGSDPSDIATVAEAHLVLGAHTTAEAWYKGFAALGSLRHRHLAEAIRELEQTWRLAAAGDERRILLLALKARSTTERVSAFKLAAAERLHVRSSNFEANLHGSDRSSYQALRKFVKAGEGLALIKDGQSIVVGTGFLLVGADISASLGSEIYLLTTTHVVCDPRLAHGGLPRGALAPEDARLHFLASSGAGDSKTYRLEPAAVWQSPANACDACLLRLRDVPIAAIPLPISSIEQDITAGDLDDPADGTRVAVIGYSSGNGDAPAAYGDLVVHQGSIVDIGPRMPNDKQPVFLHYDAPTLAGNSGSPVLDASSSQVIGLHHAGFNAREGRPRLYGHGGFHNANEGIYIHSIAKAFEASLISKRSFHFAGLVRKPRA